MDVPGMCGGHNQSSLDMHVRCRMHGPGPHPQGPPGAKQSGKRGACSSLQYGCMYVCTVCTMYTHTVWWSCFWDLFFFLSLSFLFFGLMRARMAHVSAVCPAPCRRTLPLDLFFLASGRLGWAEGLHEAPRENSRDSFEAARSLVSRCPYGLVRAYLLCVCVFVWGCMLYGSV